MDILVLGAGGLLGSNVVHHALEDDFSVSGTYYEAEPSVDAPLAKVDIRDREAIREQLEERRPDAVINCAAMTDVDACETASGVAHEINAEAPGQIASACAERAIPLVHVSTDYVFDGDTDTLYTESAAPNPIQVYGESKRDGEVRVRESEAETIIVRPSFIYGVHRSSDELTGFPAWVRDRLAAGESTPLFTDQRVTPSRAGATASTILALLETGFRGTVHVASRSCVTPYTFGQAICRQMDAPAVLLEEGSQTEVDRAAARPTDTCLAVDRVESVLDRPQPTLEADLTAIEPWLSG